MTFDGTSRQHGGPLDEDRNAVCAAREAGWFEPTPIPCGRIGELGVISGEHTYDHHVRGRRDVEHDGIGVARHGNDPRAEDVGRAE
jgi:hypothetical protein